MARSSRDDLPSNSKTVRQEESKKRKRVTNARVVKRRKPFLLRIFGDHTEGVGNYIIWDVLIPAAKSTISDMISNGIEMLLYGEPGGKRKRIRRHKDRSYVSYSSIYSDREKRPRRISPRSRSRQRFDDIVIDSRGEAEEVLSTLVELIEMYDIATVADFYDAVGVSGEFVDNKFGWDRLGNTEVVRVRDGYILDLPKPYALD